MEKLIEFIVKNSTGLEEVEIEKSEEEEGREVYTIKVPEDSIGLIIGRQGNTIKKIRNLVKVRATLEEKRVDIAVAPLS